MGMFEVAYEVEVVGVEDPEFALVLEEDDEAVDEELIGFGECVVVPLLVVLILNFGDGEYSAEVDVDFDVGDVVPVVELLLE